jgi:hypothetical protein
MRLLLLLLLALAFSMPAAAQSLTLAVFPGDGSAPRRITAPVVVLDRGPVVDGLPALRQARSETIPWHRIASIDFIPADRNPTAAIRYRDGREEMLDVEPCWLASQAAGGDSGLDIHIVSRIGVKIDANR